MRLAPMRRMAFVAILALNLAACASSDPYPLLTPAGAADYTSAAIGEVRRGLVLFLELRPGDRIELVSATAPGFASGADLTFYFSLPVFSGGGGTSLGDQLGPLPGATFAVPAGASMGPGNDVAVVAEITPRQAGTYDIENVRVTFRLNGGERQTKEGISQTFTVCAADPAPASCGETPNHP